MGVIQNTINGALGTAAVAAGAAKHFNQQQEQLTLQATQGLANLSEKEFGLKEELAKNKAFTKSVKQGMNIDSLEYDPSTGNVSGKYDLYNDTKQQRYDIKKLKTAAKTLKGNLEAMKMQREIYERVLGGNK